MNTLKYSIEVLALSQAFYFITDCQYKTKVLHKPLRIPAWEFYIYWFPGTSGALKPMKQRNSNPILFEP